MQLRFGWRWGWRGRIVPPSSIRYPPPMLRYFRNSRKTVIFILILGAATIGMTAFGVNSYGGSTGVERPLIKVGDKEVTWADIREEKRSLESYYRSILGANADKLLESMNLQQQVVDRAVDEAALDTLLDNLNFVSGSTELKSGIMEMFRGQPVSASAFASYAQSLGVSPQKLEQKLANDTRQGAFHELLSHASIPSKGELEAEVKKQETIYSVSSVSINPNDYIKDIKDPDEATIDAHYQEQASLYELPARIKYTWAEFPLEEAKKLVDVRPDDIELYFASNENEFLVPEAIRAELIKFSVPAGTLPDATEKIRVKAEEVLQKIQSGSAFTDMMVEYSDEKSQKSTPDGFLTRADLPKEVSEKLFAMKDGGTSDVIRTIDAFYIGNVKEFRASQPKPLESVKEEVIAKIKDEQAPIFAFSHLEELSKEFSISGKDLKTFAAEKKMTFGSDTELLVAGNDPEKAPKGLTQKLFDNFTTGAQLAEVDGRFILANVTETREREIPGLSEVKTKVVMDWKRNQARTKASEAAAAFLAKVTPETFNATAQSFKLKVENLADVSSKKTPALFQNRDAHDLLFSQSKPLHKVFGPVEQGGALTLWVVKTVTPPTPEVISKKLKEVENSKQMQATNLLIQGIIESLKAKQEVTIDPAAFTS